MTGSTITCAQCGHTNPTHRLWCETCRTQVPFHPKMQSTEEDRSLLDRTELYERVLKDLEELRADQQIRPDAYDTIKTCYQDQLTQIHRQIETSREARALLRLVVTARQAAHDGRYQDAIRLFGQGHVSDRGEYHLEQMVEEVREKLAQREQALQASRQAESLLRESKLSIAAHHLDEAKSKLERARKLDPFNKRIIAALQQVESQIAQQKARQEEQEQIILAELVSEPGSQGVELAVVGVTPSAVKPTAVPIATAEVGGAKSRHAKASFADDQDQVPSPTSRLIDAASKWSGVIKPFLLDNVGWFVGAFLVVAGFVVLIVTFWSNIEQNQILMHSLVYISLAVATGMFFAAAYFMRLKYPQLEASSNVLLVIVALLIPLVFAAALLTTLIPAEVLDVALLPNRG